MSQQREAQHGRLTSDARLKRFQHSASAARLKPEKHVPAVSGRFFMDLGVQRASLDQACRW